MQIIRLCCLCMGLAFVSACSRSADEQRHIGYVEADWVFVAAPQSGWLTSRPVQQGDSISVGQLLFMLDKQRQEAALAESDGRVAQSVAEEQNVSRGARPAEIRLLEAQLAEAHARLVHAVSERDRILPLVEQGVASENRGVQVVADAQVAEAAVAAAEENVKVARLAARTGIRSAAQANVAVAEARRENAQIDLRDRTITSTIDGRVEEVFYHPGEYVTAGSPILALLAEDGLKLKFYVSQARLPEMSVGKRVRARADGKAEAIDAVVSFIASEAEFTPPVIYSEDVRDKLVFLIEATLPVGSGLNPGLPVDVDW